MLSKDKNNVAAILVKAEALYNTCFFEHGLILFHRGQALAPESEEFRLGIQKCHKTIGMNQFCKNLYILNLTEIIIRIIFFSYINHPKIQKTWGKIVHSDILKRKYPIRLTIYDTRQTIYL